MVRKGKNDCVSLKMILLYVVQLRCCLGLVIIIIIMHFKVRQNEVYSPVVHDVSSSLRWLCSRHPAVKRDISLLVLLPMFLLMSVHVSKLSPAQLNHHQQTEMWNCSKSQTKKNLSDCLCQLHHGVFSIMYICSWFSEHRCTVGTSKRIIFLALPCMCLTWLTCFLLQ